ncbi:hypothetical protein [Sphingomonas sp. MS122]|uniref:hypothetical protein n=1 Tax=Sphingomonas sp. MS122 TaxID=3412683 RepID=UPI003C2DD63F
MAIALSLSTALAPAAIAPRAHAQSAAGHSEWSGKGQLFVGTCYQPVDRSPEQIKQDIAVQGRTLCVNTKNAPVTVTFEGTKTGMLSRENYTGKIELPAFGASCCNRRRNRRLPLSGIANR